MNNKAKVNVAREDLSIICEFLEQYTGTFSAQRNIEFIARAIGSASLTINDGGSDDATRNERTE